MPRPPRSYTTGVYHVAAHGSDQRYLFHHESDRAAFLDRLSLTFASLGIELISYMLMGNHYHALVHTPDARLAHGLQRVHGGYSFERHRRNGRRAHLFRAHCFARRITDNDDLATVSRYLAHNPVEAGLVLDPFDWPWGSTRAHAGLETAPVQLHEHHLEAAFGDGHDWRGRYRTFLEPETRSPPKRASRVAGAGFEPATSGL